MKNVTIMIEYDCVCASASRPRQRLMPGQRRGFHCAECFDNRRLVRRLTIAEFKKLLQEGSEDA